MRQVRCVVFQTETASKAWRPVSWVRGPWLKSRISRTIVDPDMVLFKQGSYVNPWGCGTRESTTEDENGFASYTVESVRHPGIPLRGQGGEVITYVPSSRDGSLGREDGGS